VHRFELVGQNGEQNAKSMKSGQKILCNLSAKAQGTRDTAIFFSAFLCALRISALKIEN
jgi:hypothetical protein